MKVATLQFSPRLGDLEHNIVHAETLLEASNLQDVDILVVPELALTGYNFPSLQAISEYLEPSCSGATAWWAFKIARKYGLVVSIGYPEITTDANTIPKAFPFKESSTLDEVIVATKEYITPLKSSQDPNITYWTFNSSLTIGPSGKILAHYRKTHLYYSDVTWASQSIDGFQTIPLNLASHPSTIATSFAICMDLNPKAFTAKWTAHEVANQMISTKAALLVVSTAWLAKDDAVSDEATWPCCPAETAESPEMTTVTYWIERLAPLVSSSNKTTVVIANRVGNEKGDVVSCDLDNLIRPTFQAKPKSEDKLQINDKQSTSNGHIPLDSEKEDVGDVSGAASTIPSILSSAAHYSGSSVVFTAGNGIVSIHGVLGKGTEDVLVADTDSEALMTFRLENKEDE